MNNTIAYCSAWIHGACSEPLDNAEVYKFCEDLDSFIMAEDRIMAMTTMIQQYEYSVGAEQFCKKFEEKSVSKSIMNDIASCENSNLLVPLAVTATILGIVAIPMALEVLAGGAMAVGMAMWITGE